MNDDRSAAPAPLVAWLRANAETAAAGAGLCGLLPNLFLRDPGTLRATLLAFALSALAIFATVAWNRFARAPPATTAMQLQLLPILFLGLVVRLIAAHSPGFDFDLNINRGWAQSAAQLGLARSYNEQLGGNVLPNYPPLMVILYWLTGLLYKFTLSPLFDPLLSNYNVVIRFPAIVADLTACVVVAVVTREAGASRRWALAALVYALHPVVIYDTGAWGQSDGVYALLMLLTLYALARERWLLVGIWTACAILTKPQVAAMFPVLLAMLVWRLPKSLSLFGGALVAAAAILLPFFAGGALDAVFAVYQHTVGGYYKAVSIGAYNFWGIFHRTSEHSDEDLALSLITFRSAGILMYAAASLLTLWQLRRSLFRPRDGRHRLLGIMLAGALTTSAMFIFATEMHERYQFAYVLLALPVAVMTRAGATLYAATSVLILLNLLGRFAFGAWDVALFAKVPAMPKIIAVSQVILFFVTVGAAPKLVAGATDENA